MAVRQKRNEEYWVLKERTDKWGVWLFIMGPIWTVLPLMFLGFVLTGQLFQDPVSGALIGLFAGVVILFYLIKKKIGFFLVSVECCQNCGIPLAQKTGAHFPLLDYLCRNCGNNNSLDLHAQ